MDADALLTKLGLSDYERRLYLALARLGSARASDLATETGVPRNKVYEVLERLRQSGFVMELATVPKKYKILSFDRIQSVIKERQEALAVLEKESSPIIDMLKKMATLPQEERVFIIRGKDNISKKITDELNNVEQGSLSAIRSAFAYGPTFRNIKKACERGVRCRLIALSRGENKHLIERMKVGEEIRLWNEEKFGPFGTRISLFDDYACRITVGRPEIERHEDYITIWSESPSFVRMARVLLELLWEQSIQVEIKKGKLVII